MRKEETVNYLINKLENLYPKPPIPLDHTNSYTFLIAVLLSAQSTDKKVNEITPPLFREADNPKDMTKLGEKKILKHIKQIGLCNQKAKNIFLLSQILVEKHNSLIPNNFIDLERLPGVGHKTASVVLAQIYKIPTFPIDTHIHRLAQRWGLTSGTNVKQTEKDLKKIFPENLWNKLHLQIIYFGREFCTARGCNGNTCEICQTLFPNRKEPFNHKKA
tara:strand:- start:22933 stop:23586 length:654 start_codon:yes stop_codon:yes gene_type:complete